MTLQELELQNETSLFGIMCNPSMAEEFRHGAAVLLYKRGSRYLIHEEFQRRRTQVLDHMIQEYTDAAARPGVPHVFIDAVGRLNDRITTHERQQFEVDSRFKEMNDLFTRLDSERAVLREQLAQSKHLLQSDLQTKHKILLWLIWGGAAAFVAENLGVLWIILRHVH
jgi:hypothetical protein